MCCSIECVVGSRTLVRKKQVIEAIVSYGLRKNCSSCLSMCGSVRCPVQCVVGLAIEVRGLFSLAL